jgi:hypothetical protein
MKMTNQDVINAAKLAFISCDLKLGSFSTVNQKMFIINDKNLRCMISAVGRNCRIGSQNGQMKRQNPGSIRISFPSF